MEVFYELLAKLCFCKRDLSLKGISMLAKLVDFMWGYLGAFYMLSQVSLMNEEAILTMSKVSFCKNRLNLHGCWVENNRHSEKVRLWPGNITCMHIHAQFEEDLLNMSAVISNACLEQRGHYIKTFTHLDQKQNCQETCAIDTQLHKRCKVFVGNFKRYGTFYKKNFLMKHPYAGKSVASGGSRTHASHIPGKCPNH